MRLIRLFKNDFARESMGWVKAGIISREQAEAICKRYGIDDPDKPAQSFSYAILVGLGYLFIGLSAITLIGANWDEIPRAVRMTSLILLTLCTHGLALKIFLKGKRSAAAGIFFLGSLFYGTSIMLIAQIYHIGEHYPDGIYWWALGVLPLAVFTKSYLLMLLMTILAFIWFFVESSLNFFPVTFPLFFIFITWFIFQVRESYTLFLALILGFGFWTEYLLAWHIEANYRFEFGAENIAYTIGLFILFGGLARWLDNLKTPILQDYGTLLALWTLRFTILTLFIFSFASPWEELIEAEWENPGLSVGLAIFTSVAGIYLSYLADRQILSILLYSIAYILALFFIMQTTSSYLSIYFQIVDNIVLVSTGVWLVIRGIKDGITHYFYFGVLTIMLTGLLRYMDLVGDYVGAAILFAIFATILLTTARYWKSHKEQLEVRNDE